MQNVGRASLLLALALALLLAWTRPIDARAAQSVDVSLKRALATYATARAINGLISIARTATVNVQFIAGVQVSPGAVLAPLDDFVEEFSLVMLVASASLAAQRLLLGLSESYVVLLPVSVALIAWMALLLRRGSPHPIVPRLAMVLLCLRFAVPAIALASDATYNLVLAPTYESAQADIEKAAPPDLEATSQGRLQKFKRWWEDQTDGLEKVVSLRARVDEAVEHFVRLSAVFVIQTILLPLIFLWLIVRACRRVPALVSGAMREPHQVSMTSTTT